jgi:hypothetical protein
MPISLSFSFVRSSPAGATLANRLARRRTTSALLANLATLTRNHVRLARAIGVLAFLEIATSEVRGGVTAAERRPTTRYAASFI